jgi:hypothetical protein
VSFDPFALIKGTARVGYRKFEPVIATVPEFAGTTAAVNLAYVALGTTRFDLQATRDVQYSFDINRPYYLQSGFTGSIAQQIFGPVDVVAGLGRYTLAYRDREGLATPFADRSDRVRSYHGGVGYHIGPTLRVGFKVEKQQRFSDVLQRGYEGIKLGVSVTYGQ